MGEHEKPVHLTGADDAEAVDGVPDSDGDEAYYDDEPAPDIDDPSLPPVEDPATPEPYPDMTGVDPNTAQDPEATYEAANR